jgi:phage terminase large subunit
MCEICRRFACVRTSIIYPRTLSELRKGTRRIIHQGGQYSGKTVNILGALATLCCEETEGITTVTSMSFPHLKGGALRDFELYVYPSFKSAIKSYNKTDHVFYFKSGSALEFRVFENEMAARGHKRNRLFVNEANSFSPLVFFQLDSRSDQTIIDYNPSIRFFAHDDLIGLPGNKTFYSDHRHNPFISDAKHAEIENICTFAYDDAGKQILNDKGEPVVTRGDYELWKVYARGLTGNVTGVIFPDWEVIDDEDFPFEEEAVYSIDFGYTVDPTAIMKQVKVGETLFVKELAYEPGLPPMVIQQILRGNGFDIENDVLFCEHDPDMVKQLRSKCGVSCQLARKGPGSIKAGIDLLKRFKVKYTSSSQNLHRERGLYVWDKEKDTGRMLNTPIEKHNHTFDAIRYGTYTKYLRAA